MAFFDMTDGSLLASHASSQIAEVYYSPEPVAEEEEKPEVPAAEQSINRAVNRAVQVDALLENWRVQIRKAGVESEELYIAAINDIFVTESDREESIADNMLLELEDVVDSAIASLENTIMRLADKGRATGDDDPRLKELNEKVSSAGKTIRNRAVEIR
jgi:hypothetical protein